MMVNLNPNQATTSGLVVDVPTRTEDAAGRVRIDTAEAPVIPTGSSVARAAATIEAVTTKLEKHLASLYAEDYTPNGLRNQITAFGDTPAAKAVDAAVELVQKRADAARAAVEAERQALNPTGDDVAAELRNTRYWERSRRTLDASKPATVVEVAQKLLAEARPDQIGVLAEELGPYLDSRGVQTGWIDGALDQAAPAYGKARQQLKHAEQALTVTKHNATAFRRVLETTHAPAGYRRPRFLDASAYDPDSK